MKNEYQQIKVDYTYICMHIPFAMRRLITGQTNYLIQYSAFFRLLESAFSVYLIVYKMV